MNCHAFPAAVLAAVAALVVFAAPADALGAGPAPASGRPSAAAATKASKEPIYYVFKHDRANGCSPQARYVKVVGKKYYEFLDAGCDRFIDRGRISGKQVRLVGRQQTCSANSRIEYRPSVLRIKGTPKHLRIPGEKRVVGPTHSLASLDRWWAAQMARVPDWSGKHGVDDVKVVSRAFAGAARDSWTAHFC